MENTNLANQSQDMKQVSRGSYGGGKDIINEDGELLMAFESQKKVTRQQEVDLQSNENECAPREKELRHERKVLRVVSKRPQKLFSQNLQKTFKAQNEALMQHEITRLKAENSNLRDNIDLLQEDAGVGVDQTVNFLEQSKEQRENMPVVKHKDAEYLGMFEYKKEDEPAFIKSLIYDLRPRIAVNLLTGLPAYILFMCIRHADYINDEEKLRSLLASTITGIKRVIEKRHEDLDVTIMWLANTCRLLHNLRQYSGNEVFHEENNPKQNEQCLRNFDLSEYRQVLVDIAAWIYRGVINIMEEDIQPLIIAAILEHEAILGTSGNKPSGLRGRSSSVAREVEVPCADPQQALTILVKELTAFYKVLSLHGVDPELVTQVFKQIFYFICAGAINNLLLRKELCHWSKGQQIRSNLSHLEQWCRDQKLQDAGVTESLLPIVQASQLLQARKTEEDVDSIYEMCDKLSVNQITKILNLYTPVDEFEERVLMSFIRKMQRKLMEREDSQQQATLLMDTIFVFPILFPFNPSNIQLKSIVIPDQLCLPMLKRV